MIKIDEDALICDLAETYQIYDYRQLPVKMVAVFAFGLKVDSRIKMIMSDRSVTLETMLLASISDKLNLLVWFKTADGQKGKNRPTPLVDLFTNREDAKTKKDVVIFNSGEDFEQQRKMLIQTGGE